MFIGFLKYFALPVRNNTKKQLWNLAARQGNSLCSALIYKIIIKPLWLKRQVRHKKMFILCSICGTWSLKEGSFSVGLPLYTELWDCSVNTNAALCSRSICFQAAPCSPWLPKMGHMPALNPSCCPSSAYQPHVSLSLQHVFGRSNSLSPRKLPPTAGHRTQDE